MTLGRYDETSMMIDVDEVIATCSFSRQVRIFRTFYDGDIGPPIRISFRLIPTSASASTFINNESANDVAAQTRCLFSVQAMEGNKRRPRQLSLWCGFEIWLLLDQGTLPAKVLSPFDFFFFMYLYYDTIMNTYSSTISLFL
jgi:hypothetical protein